MMSLDEEISHLQKENNHVDSQLHRMKSDVTGMETDAASEDKVDIKHLNLREEDTRHIFLFLYMTECCDRQNLCTRKNISSAASFKIVMLKLRKLCYLPF